MSGDPWTILGWVVLVGLGCVIAWILRYWLAGAVGLIGLIWLVLTVGPRFVPDVGYLLAGLGGVFLMTTWYVALGALPRAAGAVMVAPATGPAS
jgi:hypothetical protein